MRIDPTVFKAYDIRGVVGKTIDEPSPSTWAAPSAARPGRRRAAVAVGRDGRLSGPAWWRRWCAA
jgi:phosphomannomutase